MLDVTLILKSSAVAAIAAAALMLAAWVWQRRRPAWSTAGGAVGVGTGLILAACLLGLEPRVPPLEDRDRLLLVVLPAAVIAEVVAGSLRSRPWLGWLLRALVAAGAGRVLLHDSIYLDDLAGPGTREWSVEQSWLILGGLAAALMTVWALLARLAQPPTGWAVLMGLALAAAGAGLTVMLSGYASGGLLGLPLAAALGGVAVLCLVLPAAGADCRGAMGVGIVTLFALLVAGRFFGSLTTVNAAVLFAAPLLAWAPRLVPVRCLKPSVGNVLRIAFVAAPIALIVMLAAGQFQADSTRTSSNPVAGEPSREDYLNFHPSNP